MESVSCRMDGDRVNALTSSEVVYSEHQKVLFRTKGKEDRSKLLKLLVSVVTVVSRGCEKSLSIEITDEDDPFMLYSLLVSESDFQVIKEQQGLLIEYDKFSFQLAELLHLCKSDSDDGGNYHLIIEECSGEIFGNQKTLMKIVERNQFKQLCHLSLQISVGTDSEIKKHMAVQLKMLKEALYNAEKKISEAEKRAENTAKKLELREQEIQKLQEKWLEESKTVNEKTTEQIAMERENTNRIQQDMRKSFEEEKNQLQTIIKETKKSYELLVEELQTEKKMLFEQNCETDSRLRDLENKIDSLYKENCSLQQEVTMLRSQNSKLDVDYHEKEKNLNLMMKNYAMLEKDLKDKSAHLTQQEDLLRAAKYKNNLLEEDILKKNSEIARCSNSVRVLTEEVTRANEAIRSFQDEIAALKMKIKLRTKIILEQESILAQRDHDKAVLEKETEELKKKVDDLKATEKELSELLQTTKEKLNRKEEALTSNNHCVREPLESCMTGPLTKSKISGSGSPSMPTPPSQVVRSTVSKATSTEPIDIHLSDPVTVEVPATKTSDGAGRQKNYPSTRIFKPSSYFPRSSSK
ncbi:spindle assembly abnormal protein 6 homolog isoform X2 [Periplaneta americana]|uniref:spindle assembly abnormal protein 6 homolog isoform X2 n=1 Tax=Periplaneta americana TaxID=6978 RepID=UPI0037E8AE40